MLATASIYLAANVLNAAIPFLLLPVLTRTLSPAEYGVVAMFEAAVACFGVFAGLSVHGAIGVRYYRDDRATFPEYVGSCLFVLLGSTTLTAAVLVGTSAWVAPFTGLPTRWLVVAVVAAFCQSLIAVRLTIWQAGRKALRYGVFQILQTLLNGALSVLLVVWLCWGASGRIIGSAVAFLVFACVALAAMQLGGWIRWKWNRSYVDDAVAFGIPLIPHALGGFAITFADRFLINRTLGADATGVFFVAMQVSMPLLMLGSSFNKAFVPWLYEMLAKQRGALVVKVSYWSIFGFAAAGLAYGIVVHLFLPTAIGDRFVTARPVALVLIAGAVFQAAYFSVVNPIFYAKKTRWLAGVSLANGIVYLCALCLIAPAYGLQGAAWAFVGSQALTFASVWFVATRAHPLPWFQAAGCPPPPTEVGPEWGGKENGDHFQELRIDRP